MKAFVGSLLAAALMATPALAQLSKEATGVTLKPAQAKAALMGIDMEGYSPTYNMSWRECIDPKGDTIYETPGSKLKGKLLISPAGKACFSYEDDNFQSVACYTVKRTDTGAIRFEDDFKAGSVFITTKLVTGIKSCTADLIG